MVHNISFLLNDDEIVTRVAEGMILLDLIRYTLKLPGTKIGCREGDCGACTVLVGEIIDGKVMYKPIVSCLTPLGNVHGKHVVTIEGINQSKNSPVQEELIQSGGTQCGFCTPGFVVSLTGHCLNPKRDVRDSISGNICRCTGYKSIESAALQISNIAKQGNIKDCIDQGIVPEYFSSIKEKLEKLTKSNVQWEKPSEDAIKVSGGTDLYVQRPSEVSTAEIKLLTIDPSLKSIDVNGEYIQLGSTLTISEFEDIDNIQELIPGIKEYFRLFASRLIKNTATLGGNLVNASPIADSIILFLALDASITLRNGKDKRQIKLKDFYKGYKDLDLAQNEIIEHITFRKPAIGTFFNFEKVSKRTHLDIASVNSAISLQLEGTRIVRTDISIGGVAPIPVYLSKTVEYLTGKELIEETVQAAIKIAQSEVAPISDIRGSKEYKLLLARQLILAHFIKFFPEKITLQGVVS
ncbi:MAG: FAD binding domain-containing protein [Candidatus Kariarchaeaceae archaeon]|jgi:xanthine dehydrogenase small subunit